MNLITTLPQVRTKFSNLLELGADIKRRGLLQPIVVRPDGNGYVLVIGERRFRAMQLAGCLEAPAIIADVKDSDLLEIQLIENIQRDNLGAKDLMEAIKALYDKHRSVKKVSEVINKSQAWVSKKVATAMQMGPLTGQLLANDVKDGELLYSFSKLETIDTAAALDLVQEIVDRKAGRKEVQEALKNAVTPEKTEPVKDDKTGDLFAEPETPSAKEVALKKLAELIEIYAPKGANASEKPYLEAKKSNEKIREIWEEAREALANISHAK